MSRIDKLIECLCPNGVEYKALGDCLGYEQPTPYLVSSTDYSDAYETPVLTAGQTFVLGYTNETTGIYEASQQDPVIIFDDFTTAFKWVDFPFKAKSSAMKMLRPLANADIIFRYVFYAMQCIGYIPEDHKRHWIGTYSAFRIPVPPLEIQQEIVRVLDSFAELETELEAELEARHSQFDYYRNRMLIDSAEGAEKVQLAKVGTFTGSTPKKSEQRFFGDEHPFYKPGDFNAGESIGASEDGLTSEGLAASRIVPQDATMVVCIGATIGKVGYALETGSCNQQINVILPNEDFNPRYVFHLANSRIVQDQIAHLGNFSSMPILSLKKFNQIAIPMPSRELQDRVADALDKFDAIVHDISDGIPAEISARHAQYAYYRDRLLAFREKVA